jgi:hypothetical protein
MFPLQASLWRQMAQIHTSKGKRVAVVKMLLRGRFHFRRKVDRPEAIALLREALALDPTLFEVKLNLALQLARKQQLMLEVKDGRQLRRWRWTLGAWPQARGGLGAVAARRGAEALTV